MLCIASGNLHYVEKVLQLLSPVEVPFEIAVLLMSQFERLAGSISREGEWIKVFRPEFYAKQSEQVDKQNAEQKEVRARIQKMLTGEEKQSYRS